MMFRAMLATATIAAASATGAHAQTTFPDLPSGSLVQDCGAAGASSDICRLREAVPAATLATQLGDARAAVWREGDRLLVAVRTGSAEPMLAGSILAPLAKVEGADLATLVVRIPRLDEALIDVFLVGGEGPVSPQVYRGPKAPPAQTPIPELRGRLVEESIDSKALGAPRGLTVYLPPGFDQARTYPVAYLADGRSVAFYARLIETAILDGRVRPVVLVGVHSGQGQQRAIDYLLDWKGSDAGFEAHERFFLEEVMPRAEALYGASKKREERLVTGKSNGGDWALDIALRHPDLFAQAAPAAMARSKAKGVETPGRPRLFVTTGLFDPGIARSRETAARARTSGDEVVLVEPVSGHGGLFYQERLVEILAWAFGRP
jgi:hypothetical protein